MDKIVRHDNYRCYYYPYREHVDIELATPRCQYEFEKECLGLRYPYTWGWQ